MDDTLKISLAEVSTTASAIRADNAKLDDTLTYVSRLMNDLNSIWQSEGEETLLNRFNNFAHKFVNESEIIESYAHFLDETVANYDSLESTIVANAANFN